MEKNKRYLYSILLSISILFAVSMMAYSLSSEVSLIRILLSFLILLVFISLAFMVFMFWRLFTQTPSTLTMSVLGYPHSGKTVYLTVLFSELMSGNSQKNISFRAYGSETLERISTDYRLLCKGVWLPPTPNEGVFYYRATVGLSNLKKYKLEIGDFAGEKFRNDLQDNNSFFHKTEYFKYVILSDIVFLAIDIEQVCASIHHNIDYITNIETSCIASLTIMQESKNIGFNKRIRFPVALLFLKADLLEKKNLDEQSICEYFRKLIGFCKTNCNNFKYFFVSSTGTENLEEGNLAKMQPQGIMEPVVWSILKHRS